MDHNAKEKLRDIFTEYLIDNHLHKTPERYHILDAVFSLKGLVSLDDIRTCLEEQNFHVSRATLYNTMNLLLRMKLVEKHYLQSGVKYAVCYNLNGRCLQICTVCGKETEPHLKSVVNAINEAKLKRFRREGFSLYIYGVCSSCLAKRTRKKQELKQ